MTENKKMIPRLSRFALRSTAIIASSVGVYELAIHDWGRGIGFGVSWLLLLFVERKINKLPSDSD